MQVGFFFKIEAYCFPLQIFHFLLRPTVFLGYQMELKKHPAVFEHQEILAELLPLGYRLITVV